jgi:hypothetical protein
MDFGATVFCGFVSCLFAIFITLIAGGVLGDDNDKEVEKQDPVKVWGWVLAAAAMWGHFFALYSSRFCFEVGYK